MVRLYLVRHGKAAASFGEARDPGLDPTGRAQAEKLAERVAPLGPLPIVSSPLRRTRETAAPLERMAEGDDRVIGFAPDNCSLTVLDVEDGRLRLVRRGAEAATPVL